jgi:protein-S-isoprenylcysteine O-methyltransferase Ste14
MSLFLSLPGQIVFYVVLVLLIAIQNTMILVLRRRAPPLKTKSESKASSLRIWNLSPLLTLFVTLLLGYTQIGPLPDWGYYPGLLVAILGFAVVYWGYWTLGRYLSPELVIYQGHQLVERGPFRFVRHPVYSGLLLAVVGFGFAVQSWAAIVCDVIIYAVSFGYRLRAEEGLLISEFGDQYKSYSRRVKRLIPFIY